MSTRQEDIILAVLTAAARQGVHRLLKTMLVKLLYLVDIHAAEAQGGKTATGWQWRFMHYGPYTISFEDVTDRLEAAGWITADRQVSDDKECVLYSLSGSREMLSLVEIGLPRHVDLALAGDVKRYAGAPLRKILDYVYFHTLPMEDAEPGAVLRFDQCEFLPPDMLRPIEMRRLRPKAVRRTRERVRELIGVIKQQQRRHFESGPYDETYYQGLRELEGEPLESGCRGNARIPHKH